MSVFVKNILLLILFAIVFISLLANPAPVTIEVFDFILIFLSMILGIFSIPMADIYKVNKIEYNLIVAIIFYLSYLLLSGLIGILNSVPLFTVLRSVGPYINFFPLILIGFLPKKIINATSIATMLIFVGVLQAAYLFYLYFSYTSQSQTIINVLTNRITFLDKRTTLPLLLSVVILPVTYMVRSQSILRTVLFASLVLFGILGAILTLTRSIILSIFFGWFVLIIIYLYFQNKVNHVSLVISSRKLFLCIFYFGMILVLISFIPKVNIIETGLVSRFYDHASSDGTDYTNGRLYDEWLPALTTWFNAGWISRLFGIGAGHSFVVLNGEERTYIHNLCIYSLVYGGFYGLFTCLWLYISVFNALIIRAFETRDAIYLAFSTLLASMFVYAQFFAVHKGLAFNVMLFLMIALALSQPKKNEFNASGV